MGLSSNGGHLLGDRGSSPFGSTNKDMIFLREATDADLELIMAWRSNPLVYAGFYQQTEPLKWEEHLAWYKSRNQDWRTFIVLYGDRKVGVVTIGQLDHWSPEIGWYIGEVSLWGQGVGTEAVRQGLKYIKTYGREYTHTTILKNNKASLKLAQRLGFEIMGNARKGELWLTKKL